MSLALLGVDHSLDSYHPVQGEVSRDVLVRLFLVTPDLMRTRMLSALSTHANGKPWLLGTKPKQGFGYDVAGRSVYGRTRPVPVLSCRKRLGHEKE